MDQNQTTISKHHLYGVVIITLLFVMVALGAYTHKTLREAKVLNSIPASISVSGEGEVIAVPDIATFSYSVRVEADTAAAAQSLAAKDANAILAYLEDAGIEKSDIETTAYNLYPQYDWIETICEIGVPCDRSERVQTGFEVSQSVQVKVREIDTAGEILSGAGERGATNLSGLSFTIDDQDVLVAEAQAAAIIDAKAKAKELAGSLGVSLDRLVSFYDESGGRYPEPVYQARALADFAVEESFAPEISVGENTITARVNLTYEVR